MTDTLMDASRASRRSRWRWTNGPLGGAALAAMCLAVYLPGLFTLPPIDRDEARFAGATRNMLAGDSWRSYVVPQFDGGPRINKPPLTYWVQAPLVALTGRPDAIWSYRLASVLAALGAALLIWRLGASMFAPPVGWIAGALLGACMLVQFDAHQARADQLMLACTCFAQLALWRLWRARRGVTRHESAWRHAFWIAVGLGAMAKGPITPAVAALTVLGLCAMSGDWRWLRRLRIVRGLLIVAVITVPWMAMVGQEVGWRRLAFAIAKETGGRAAKSIEGHWGPPGYYVALLPALFWPGSLLLAPAALLARRRAWRVASTTRGLLARWRALRAGRDAEFFCVAWLAPSWIVFELCMTKLPHYTLPLYPAVALLCARAVFSRRLWERVLASKLAWAGLWGWTFIGELLILAPTAIVWLSDSAPFWARIAAPLAGAGAQIAMILALRRMRQRAPLQALRATLATTVIVTLSLFQIALPYADVVWICPKVARAIEAADPTEARPLADFGFNMDSLVFLTNGRVERLEPSEFEEWAAAHPDGLALWSARNGEVDRPAIAEFHGFDYSTGRWAAVSLIDLAPSNSRTPITK